MPNEAGDMKLLGNFRKEIDYVSADSTYNPSNPALAKTALEDLYAAGLAAVQEVSNKMAPNKLAIDARQTAFEALGSLVKRSRNLLKASGASSKVLDDAETLVRKLTGTRKSPKVKDDPKTPQNEADANNSASQMSYDNRLGNFGGYVAILKNVPEYNPNETDLKLTGLNATLADLQAKNNAVSSTFVPLSQARGVRDNLLYTGAGCVVNTALLVKAYVNGALGPSSQLNKQIKGLQFQRQRK
jgi:hypothetical protein